MLAAVNRKNMYGHHYAGKIIIGEVNIFQVWQPSWTQYWISSHPIMFYIFLHSKLVILFCNIMLYEMNSKPVKNMSYLYLDETCSVCNKGVDYFRSRIFVISWQEIYTFSLCYECSSLSKAIKLAKAYT